MINTKIFGTEPNIIFVMADDMGYNDIGFNNENIETPNMDRLAKDGIILKQNYMQPTCTPSRAAFLTGMYPYHIGRQGGKYLVFICYLIQLNVFYHYYLNSSRPILIMFHLRAPNAKFSNWAIFKPNSNISSNEKIKI